MRLAMVPSQVQEGTLIQAGQCDYGIRPEEEVFISLDCLMVGDKFVPCVTIKHEETELKVRFTDGIPTKPFTTASLRLQHFREHVEFSICQQDPLGTVTIVALNYMGLHFEAEVPVWKLDPFMTFVFKDDDPAEPDSSEIAESDHIGA